MYNTVGKNRKLVIVPECNDEMPCQGLGEHAHFSNFGMAFLTLFRVATGDNWNGIMKDTLRDDCDEAADCVKNCCVSTIIAPIFFVIFVLMAQFVLVNVVVAVLMKHLEESHKQMEDELDMETQLERELAAEQEELLEVEEEDDEDDSPRRERDVDDGVGEDDDARERESILVTNDKIPIGRPGLAKVRSLPANFIYNPPRERSGGDDGGSVSLSLARRSSYHRPNSRPSKFKSKRRQTFHSGHHHQRRSLLPMHFEVAEVFEKPVSNLSVPRIISQHSYVPVTRDTTGLQQQRQRLQATSDARDNKPLLSVTRPSAASSSSPVTPTGSVAALTCPKPTSERYLLPTATVYPSKATLTRRPSGDSQTQQSDANASSGIGSGNGGGGASKTMNGGYSTGDRNDQASKITIVKSETDGKRVTDERRVSAPPTDDFDVQSIINERRPSKLKAGGSTAVLASVPDQYSSAIRAGSYGRVYVAEETGNASDSMIGSGNGSSGSGSASGSVSRTGSAVVYIPDSVCQSIGTDVRIYVDDTDSTSSNGLLRRRRQSDETPDVSTMVSSVTPMQEDEPDDTEAANSDRPEERPSSDDGPVDPS